MIEVSSICVAKNDTSNIHRRLESHLLFSQGMMECSRYFEVPLAVLSAYFFKKIPVVQNAIDPSGFDGFASNLIRHALAAFLCYTTATLIVASLRGCVHIILQLAPSSSVDVFIQNHV